MLKIGITGQSGFIGSALYNKLSLLSDDFEIIPFDKEIFKDELFFIEWVRKCDVIVHLSALNRHEEESVIYDTNISLVQQLLCAIDTAGTAPHILISSSSQELYENAYGKSKKIGRELIRDWAKNKNSIFTGMVIPNVFGPFGKPFYNSVISTFCYQLCNNNTPKIVSNSLLKLIYIDELVDQIIDAIVSRINIPLFHVKHTSELYVSEILEKLVEFKSSYFDSGFFPSIRNDFERNLFNTFRSYINLEVKFPFLLHSNTDERGRFVEIIKSNIGGQVSFSTTLPGITRGNHFHTRKIERFAVIKGEAEIQMRKYNTDEVIIFKVDGGHPSFVDMPIWYVHNIKNVGDDVLYTLFWINEFYDPNDPDTYFEKV